MAICNNTITETLNNACEAFDSIHEIARAIEHGGFDNAALARAIINIAFDAANATGSVRDKVSA